MFNWLKKIFTTEKTCCKAGKVNLNLSVVDTEKIQKLDDLIVVGEILNIRDHASEKVTKVKVTTCNLGNGEQAQILCGASNIRVGQIVPVAKVGAKLSADFSIAERDIRGETSFGMICAKDELGLEKINEGIWELPDSCKTFLGKSLKNII
jgi:phenylalanyl-tRNA synthetase beta chain